MVWFGDVERSGKANWASHPENGAHTARTLGVKPHESGAAPRKYMPMARTQLAVEQKETGGPDLSAQGRQPPLSLGPWRFQRPDNGARTNPVPNIGISCWH